MSPRVPKYPAAKLPQPSKLVHGANCVHWKTERLGWLNPSREPLILISLVDGRTGSAFARFVPSASAEEHLKVLRGYVEQWGRPSVVGSSSRGLRVMSQIHRALGELDIQWAWGDLPASDGRVGRFFGEVHHRLLPWFQTSAASTLEHANRYLEQVYLPRWNLNNGTPDFVENHRPAPSTQELDSIFSIVTLRVMGNNNVIQYKNRSYGLPPGDDPERLRGSVIRLEAHLDGGLHFRLANCDAEIELVEIEEPGESSTKEVVKPSKRATKRGHNRAWMKGFLERPAPPIWKSFRSI